MNFFQITSAVVSLTLLSACQTGQALDSVANDPQVAATEQATDQAIATSNTAIPTPSPEQAAATQAPQTQNSAAISNSQNSLAIMAAEDVPTNPVASSSNQQANSIEQTTIPTPSPNANPITSEEVQLASLPSSKSPIVEAQPAIQRPRTQKTYLINGLFSAVPFIGYGFRNLHKKMPEAQIHSYISPVESNAVIMPKVIKDIEAAYKKDPNVAVNLIGISLGADFVTVVAERLNKKNIPVNYLGIVDGTNLRPITPNVVKADNLTCTFLDCTKAKARLARGNTTTIFKQKKYKSSHIPLGDNAELHAHVIAQSRS